MAKSDPVFWGILRATGVIAGIVFSEDYRETLRIRSIREKAEIRYLNQCINYDDCVDALVVAAAGLGVGGKVEME